VAQVVRNVWNRFTGHFIELWNKESTGSSLFPEALFSGDDGAAAAMQTAFIQSLFSDALLFAGCSMIRRIVGIAHVADFESIESKDVRAVCEVRALRLGRELLVNRGAYASIEAVAEVAMVWRQDGQKPFYPLMLSPDA
jgi:5-methylthioribose kinase